MEVTHNVVGWFEIPVSDMDRAIRFYEDVLGVKLNKQKMGTAVMAWFPVFEKEIGSPGALIYEPEYYTPSAQGTLVYFTAFSGDLSNELGRVEKAGGKVVIPKILISADIGYMAVITDTEGNRIALHSRK